MSELVNLMFCFRCFQRQTFRTIDTQELLWVCGVCGGVRDLTDEGRDD